MTIDHPPMTRRNWIKPGLYTSSNKLVVILCGLVNFVLLARMLTKNDFGVWVLFMSVVSILETLRAAFIKPSLIAHLAGSHGSRDSTASASLLLNLMYSLAISLLMVVVSVPLESFWGAPPLSLLLKIFAIINLVFVPFSHYEYIQQSVLEFKGIFYSHLVRSVIPTLYIATMFVRREAIGLPELAWVVLAGNAAGMLVCIYFARDVLHAVVLPARKVFAEMSRFGVYAFGANLSGLVSRNMDTWMIGRMISMAGVAVYTPAIRVANLVEVPTLTVADIVFPKFVKQHGKDDRKDIARLYEKSVGLVMAVMIPALLFIFFFSDWIVLIIAGPRYTASGDLLRITAFYCFFIPFGRQFGILLDAVRKPEINFYFMLSTATLNVVLNYFFILYWGVTGAALATLLTYLTRFIIQQIILFEMFGIFTKRVFQYSWSFYIEGYSFLKTMVARYG